TPPPTCLTWPHRSTTCRVASPRPDAGTRASLPSRRRWGSTTTWQRPTVRPPPHLAASLNNLSGRLAEAGRRDEGLAAIEEAVGVRRLAGANPGAYFPDLARSLNNLSLRLADAGRLDEAEAAANEGTDAYAECDRRGWLKGTS